MPEFGIVKWIGRMPRVCRTWTVGVEFVRNFSLRSFPLFLSVQSIWAYHSLPSLSCSDCLTDYCNRISHLLFCPFASEHTHSHTVTHTCAPDRNERTDMYACERVGPGSPFVILIVDPSSSDFGVLLPAQDNAIGSGDGRFEGRRYFTAKENFAKFLPLAVLTRVDHYAGRPRSGEHSFPFAVCYVRPCAVYVPCLQLATLRVLAKQPILSSQRRSQPRKANASGESEFTVCVYVLWCCASRMCCCLKLEAKKRESKAFGETYCEAADTH